VSHNLAGAPNIPVLETSRLRLRALTLEDFTPLAQLWQHVDVVRYITGTPLSLEAIWSKMLQMAGHWALLGFGYWVIEDKERKTFYGSAGLGFFKRGLPAPFDEVPEMGWVLHPDFHGHGYAFEAVDAILHWVPKRFGATPLVCMIDPDNQASLKLARKSGFTLTQETLYREERILLFQRL
jgi:RimJ/RimL family protein N-acetyltransferase